MTLDNCNDVLKVEEARAILRIGKNKMYEKLKSGEIQSRRNGRDYIISKYEIAKYLGITYNSTYSDSRLPTSERSENIDR